MKLFHFFALILAVLDCSSITLAQEAKRPFTVADDIAFTHFVWGGDAYSGLRTGGEALRFSPNGELLSYGRQDGGVVVALSPF